MPGTIRVQSQLSGELDSLRAYVTAMDNALNDFEAFAENRLREWDGAAAGSYRSAKAQWDSAISDLFIKLNSAPGVVADIAGQHLAADRTSAGYFGG